MAQVPPAILTAPIIFFQTVFELFKIGVISCNFSLIWKMWFITTSQFQTADMGTQAISLTSFNCFVGILPPFFFGSRESITFFMSSGVTGKKENSESTLTH